jgi:acyl-CoA reductase-like NAD-dependent aldehyde dehydrogenase
MVNGNPQLMAILGDVWIKMRNFPEAEKVAKRLKAMLPPEVKAAEEDDGQKPQIPPEVEQMMQQAAQRIQELEGALQEATSGMQAKQLDADVRLQVAQMAEETKRYVADTSNDTKKDVEELKTLLHLVLASMPPPPQLAAEVAGDMNEDNPPTEAGFSFPQ